MGYGIGPACRGTSFYGAGRPRSSLRDSGLFRVQPSVETLGYSRLSLRDRKERQKCAGVFGHSYFGLLSSFGIRHSDFTRPGSFARNRFVQIQQHPRHSGPGLGLFRLLVAIELPALGNDEVLESPGFVGPRSSSETEPESILEPVRIGFPDVAQYSRAK